MHPTGNLRLLDKMASSGLITAEQRESVLSGVHSLGERFEEAILDRAWGVFVACGVLVGLGVSVTLGATAV